MAKKKKNFFDLPDKAISFEELVEVRKAEMEGMRPGLTSEVKVGRLSTRVASPRPFERSTFRMAQEVVI